uniref:SSAP RNA binding domain-containing protein n=1 Tax=Arsenophonus endosymbiont of Trialeurodes vaporariorum TaxID=235567 RepID=A0A3B0M759_9GAMM
MSKAQHTEKEKSFQQQVWETLYAINVNEKIEKKNGFSYLSWAWAWGVLIAHYPESYYVIDAVSYNNDGSAMVSLTLTVKQGNNACPRKM